MSRRFIVITALFTVSILTVWVTFDAFAAIPPEAKGDTTLIKVQGVIDQVEKTEQLLDLAAPVPYTNMMIAPVFDNTGAVVSDPTGTMFNSNQSADMAVPVPSGVVMIAPVFDNTGAIVSDPTGMILSVIKP